MKQYAGPGIPRVMAEMPIELVEALQAAHAEHRITERGALVGVPAVRADGRL